VVGPAQDACTSPSRWFAGDAGWSVEDRHNQALLRPPQNCFAAPATPAETTEEEVRGSRRQDTRFTVPKQPALVSSSAQGAASHWLGCARPYPATNLDAATRLGGGGCDI
jgi:hypothetical protein